MDQASSRDSIRIAGRSRVYIRWQLFKFQKSFAEELGQLHCSSLLVWQHYLSGIQHRMHRFKIIMYIRTKFLEIFKSTPIEHASTYIVEITTFYSHLIGSEVSCPFDVY